MRKEFELTDDQLKSLLDEAWRSLGNELGFEYMTVRPISGKGHNHFTAEVKDIKE